MDVRRLTRRDAGIARAALCGIKLQGHPTASLPSPEALADWLGEEANVLLVALESGCPVGFALGYFLDRAGEACRMLFLYEVEVLATRRRCGIGRRLVGEMRRLARHDGCAKLWVVTEAENDAARALYASAGGLPGAPSLVFEWRRRINLERNE